MRFEFYWWLFGFLPIKCTQSSMSLPMRNYFIFKTYFLWRMFRWTIFLRWGSCYNIYSLIPLCRKCCFIRRNIALNNSTCSNSKHILIHFFICSSIRVSSIIITKVKLAWESSPLFLLKVCFNITIRSLIRVSILRSINKDNSCSRWDFTVSNDSVQFSLRTLRNQYTRLVLFHWTRYNSTSNCWICIIT